MTEQNSEFYHPGETRLQESVGSRGRTEEMGRVLMKGYLIQQHRDFFAGLDYLFLSAVDAHGNLRAMMVSGECGFLSTPNDRLLRLDTKTSDALAQLGDLPSGAKVGVIGIDMSNRRRNRMHGTIDTVSNTHIDIRVSQSYGNCPKYINIRELTARFGPVDQSKTQTRLELNDTDRAAIRAADTFFIASYFDAGKGDPFEGADMSHRGGLPGFVHLDGDTLTVPDYRGNNLFNTFGNLIVNPVTALLFVDFHTGETRHLTGAAKVISNPARLAQFPEALRLLQVTVTDVKSTTNATPLRWALREVSPNNSNPSHLT